MPRTCDIRISKGAAIPLQDIEQGLYNPDYIEICPQDDHESKSEEEEDEDQKNRDNEAMFPHTTEIIVTNQITLPRTLTFESAVLGEVIWFVTIGFC